VQDTVANATGWADLQTKFPLIPDTNGGYGQQVNFRLDIQNVTTRAAKNVRARLTARWNKDGVGPTPLGDSVPCPPRT